MGKCTEHRHFDVDWLCFVNWVARTFKIRSLRVKLESICFFFLHINIIYNKFILMIIFYIILY